MTEAPGLPAEDAEAAVSGEVTEADRQDVLQALTSSTPVPKLDPQAEEHGRQTIVFRRVYGWVLLAALLFQVLMADAVFIVYSIAGVHWKIPGGVMTAWLSSTVVEVIGVVYAITRSLFPLADKGSRAKVKL